MFQIVDFGRSVPYPFSNSITMAILASPSLLTLGQFGLQVGEDGQVLINATVGTQTTLGAPDVLYSIIRDNILIGTISASSLPQNQYNEVSFSFVDTDVSTGYFSYTLTAEITNAIISNRANVIGPIVFSGLSLSNIG